MKNALPTTLVTLCGFLIAASITRAAVISDSVVNPGNGHSYCLLRQSPWTASESEALTLGGHLATVRYSAENNWIYSNFSQFGGVDRVE